jgi:thiol-disulfide isomerase/thioredoxin
MNTNIKYMFFTSLLMFLSACSSSGAQKRNAELIVTYQGGEVYRAGSKYQSYFDMKVRADRPEKKYIIFGARWCDTCDQLNLLLKQSGHETSDQVSLLDVEEDWASNLAKAYSIMILPTMIVVSEKNIIIGKIQGPSKIIMHLLINVEVKNED